LFGCALGIFVETSEGILRENLANIIAQNKRLIGIIFAAALILLVPLVAMQFTEEVNWDLFDFAFMGALLLGVGLTYELAARRAGTMAYRAAAGVALAAAFLLVWLNRAVGTEEDNSAGLMFLGVLVAGIGAIIARFRPKGMARALLVTALAQVLVAVMAMIAWQQYVEVLILNAFFVALWIGSALLFRRAARQHG
jgi:ABC-type Mn2+/Zn2+ transport system permease subunit